MPAPIIPPTHPDTLPVEHYLTPWELEYRLQAAIKLRAGSLDHPWFARQDRRAGIRMWLSMIDSNVPSTFRQGPPIPRPTPEPPEGPR
jgi:hypothetical protein